MAINKKYPVVKDSHDHRDVHLSYYEGAHYPTKASLRDKMSPVVDQGELGSCTANAMASGLREYLELKAGKPLTRLSRLYLYWHERQVEGTIDEDAGAEIRDGMRILQKIGVCREDLCPYDISKFTEAPSAEAEQEAKDFKIAGYHRVTSLGGIKYAITHGLPIVIGIQVYASFESEEVAQTGMVPMPQQGEECLGGHAVLIVGYDDEKQLLEVRNSWGEGWGDKGYFYLPYDFLAQGYVMDMWTGH